MESKIIQDASRYQQSIDFAFLKTKGQNKIILKAGSGSLSKDIMWESHYTKGIENGFSIAPYFWHDPIYDATAQAKFFVGLTSNKNIPFVVIDFEQWWADWQKWSDWNAGKITQKQVPVVPADQLFNHFKTVHQYLIQQLTPLGIEVVTYTAAWFLNSYCKQAYSYLKDYYTHWADYSLLTTTKELTTWEHLEEIQPVGKKIQTLPSTYPLDKVLMWQYSGDKYTAPGVYGDVNKTKLSELDLNLWIHPKITWNDFISTSCNGTLPPENPINTTPIKEIMIESDKKLNVLNVPYVSQLESGALQYNNDCGAASGVMLIQAYTGEQMTVDQFYKETGMTYDAYLSASQVINVMSKHNLGSKWFISNMESLMQNLRLAKPTICLILYKVLVDAGLTESKFTGFHFIVAVGYDTKNIYVNDPLWKGTGGNQLAIPFATFEKAWKDAGANPNINPAYGCIVPNNSMDTATPSVYDKYRVTATSLYIRSGAGTNYPAIGSLKYNDERYVSNISDGWAKLATEAGYCSAQYLVKI